MSSKILITQNEALVPYNKIEYITEIFPKQEGEEFFTFAVGAGNREFYFKFAFENVAQEARMEIRDAIVRCSKHEKGE